MNEHEDPNAGETATKTPPSIAPATAPGSKPNQEADKISKSDKIMIGATIVIAFGTLVSAWAIVLQWREMHTGGVDTKAIAEASGRNAAAAEGFERAADGINYRLKTAVDKLNAQAGATHDLAMTAGKQEIQASIQAQEAKVAADAAKKAADTSVETLHKTQRPWVNAETFEIKSIVLPPAGRVMIFGNLVLKNTGISVANEIWSMMAFVPNNTNFLTREWDAACKITDQQMEASKESARRGFGDTWPIGLVLTPNQESGTLVRGIGDPDSLPREAIESGFYLVGCARYKDQFMQKHTTRFCFTPDNPVYRADGTVNNFGFKTCEAFQSAD